MTDIEHLIDAALSRHFETSAKPTVPGDGVVYKIDEKFGRKPYWRDSVRPERFKATVESGVLYRQNIVTDLLGKVNEAVSMGVDSGFVVKGPQGIGKSHSLVNLVLKLQADANCLVTFLPDCYKWDGAGYLLKMICGSFGTKPEDVQAPEIVPGQKDYYPRQITTIVDAIADNLATKGKHWVLIFDQVNKLFPRTGKSSISALPFPYSMISQIRKPRGVISILSASANNQFTDTHESFIEYQHPVHMDDGELVKVFGPVAIKEEVQRFAGNIPHYVGLFIKEEEENFLKKVDLDIALSAEGLHEEHPTRWAGVLEAIILCVLKQGRDKVFPYDKKFLLPESPTGSRLVYFNPLFPAVLSSYRSRYWDEVMKHVERREATYVDVCVQGEVDNGTRGRIFEAIVLHRIRLHGLSFSGEWGGAHEDIQITGGEFKWFSGSKLPTYADMSCREGTVYIPDSASFPAIDFFIQKGNTLVAFQVHISKHKDVANTFSGLCRDAQWSRFNKIVLIYLCPNRASQERVKVLIQEGSHSSSGTRNTSGVTIHLDSKTCAEFPNVLDNLVWPDRVLEF
jgi:hypothetical protein